MRFDTKEKYSDPVAHRNGHAGYTYAVNGTATTGTQTVRNDVEEETLNVYEWGYQQILLEKDFNSYRMTVSQR